MALVFLQKYHFFQKLLKTLKIYLRIPFPLYLMVKLFFENVDFEIFSATMKILENFQNVRKNYFWLENKMMGSYKPESFGLMILQCSQAEK